MINVEFGSGYHRTDAFPEVLADTGGCAPAWGAERAAQDSKRETQTSDRVTLRTPREKHYSACNMYTKVIQRCQQLSESTSLERDVFVAKFTGLDAVICTAFRARDTDY